MLENAFILDPLGDPVRHGGDTKSTDWDEIQAFCRDVYMPYDVRPMERQAKPDATMISAKAGGVTMTRFAYGTGIYLNNFDPAAGNILVLNTVRGALNHAADGGSVATGAGESFVVDCSRAEYWLEGDPDHMQLNLTIPHDLIEQIAERWFGFVPGDALWTSRVKIGGVQTAWGSLLDYSVRALTRSGVVAEDAAIARHLEEILCVELLRQWAGAAGVKLEGGARAAAPRYVRQAEAIMEAEARQAPTIGEIAKRVGVSARTLSGGFQQFRGLSPRDFLVARRLEGFRADLEKAEADKTVTDIATRWGYSNFGALAGRYRQRYGELPSRTRARAMGGH
ncbi:AraC family transcriptional regulator [Celeribacter ethanolicus]|uniref:AraC family transcriptional regulator n=1 Tax=Celeribacter ethanolicus TaxID=1758178 RepID=A0A291GF94_9RHOB|nr:helix-turn-helix transcriptional regulator [Celeribacter ethanolicus]ATG49059.1 AraC family transcriptional regulator [Celeribacter ethanolicus]